MKKTTKNILLCLIALLIISSVIIVVKLTSKSAGKLDENKGIESSGLISQISETSKVNQESKIENIDEEKGLVNLLDAYAIYDMESEIVYFGKDTCGTCQEFQPLLEQIIGEKDLKVYYFNTNYFRENTDISEDDLQKIFDDFTVNAVPAIYEIRNGKVFRSVQISSYYNMGEDAMKEAAEEFLSK